MSKLNYFISKLDNCITKLNYCIMNLRGLLLTPDPLCLFFFFVIAQLTFFQLNCKSEHKQVNWMNINKWILSLTVPSFEFNFNSKKNKNIKLSLILNTKSTSWINISSTLKHIFYSKSKLNQVYFVTLPD